MGDCAVAAELLTLAERKEAEVFATLLAMREQQMREFHQRFADIQAQVHGLCKLGRHHHGQQLAAVPRGSRSPPIAPLSHAPAVSTPNHCVTQEALASVSSVVRWFREK